MSNDWYLDKAWDEHDHHEIVFKALKGRTDAWIEKAFELLSNCHIFYQLAAKALKSQRLAKEAFPDCDFDKETNDESEKQADKETDDDWQEQFLDYLDSKSAPIDQKSEIIKKMNPSRFFLFTVLKADIKRFRMAKETVPDTYLKLEQEYSNIIEDLCISHLILVPKLCWEPKGYLSPSERRGEGNVGLVLAAHKYDFNRTANDKPIKFGTVARLWILAEIGNRIYRDTFYFKGVSGKARQAYLKYFKDTEINNELAQEITGLDPPLSLDYITQWEGISLVDIIDNSRSMGTPLKNPEEEVSQGEWIANADKRFKEILTDEDRYVLYRKLVLDGRPDKDDDWAVEMERKIPAADRPHILRTALDKVRRDKRCLELFKSL